MASCELRATCNFQHWRNNLQRKLGKGGERGGGRKGWREYAVRTALGRGVARVRAEKRDIRETVIGYAALTRARDFTTRIPVLVPCDSRQQQKVIINSD